MARFDVYAGHETGLLLDIQANVLGDLTTRIVVPLRVETSRPRPIARLNPILLIEDKRYFMHTQLATAVGLRDLGPFVVNLGDQEWPITSAIDLLFFGI